MKEIVCVDVNSRYRLRRVKGECGRALARARASARNVKDSKGAVRRAQEAVTYNVRVFGVSGNRRPGDAGR